MPNQGRQEPQGHVSRYRQVVQEQIRGHCAMSMSMASKVLYFFKRCVCGLRQLRVVQCSVSKSRWFKDSKIEILERR